VIDLGLGEVVGEDRPVEDQIQSPPVAQAGVPDPVGGSQQVVEHPFGHVAGDVGEPIQFVEIADEIEQLVDRHWAIPELIPGQFDDAALEILDLLPGISVIGHEDATVMGPAALGKGASASTLRSSVHPTVRCRRQSRRYTSRRCPTRKTITSRASSSMRYRIR
jgi:hypothetical protein